MGCLIWGNRYFSLRYPGGNQLFPYWVAARALLLDGRSPYSEAVNSDIQRLGDINSIELSKDEAQIKTPLYSMVLYFPLALIDDFILVRIVWMAVLEVALFSLTFINLRLTNWKPGIWLLTLYLFFALLWYHAIVPLITGDAAILVGLFLAGFFLAIREGWDEIAGVFLALTSIKPEIVILLIAFVVLWALSRRRWRIIVWMVITLGVLSVIAAVFLPDWPLQYLLVTIHNIKIFPPGTISGIFETRWPAAGAKIGWAFSVLLAGLLLLEWYASRGKDFRWFLWTASLTLVINQWIGLQTDPGNFIILSTALVLVFSVSEQRWGKKGRAGVVISISSLFVGLWALFLRPLMGGDQPPQSLIMLFPLPLFLLIGLYWVRWWAMKPALMPLEELRGG